jgi:hypothetical protein
MLLSDSFVAPLMTAWSGYHLLLLLADALDDVVGLADGRDMPPAPPAAEPVVLGLADDVLTGSLTNFSLSN